MSADFQDTIEVRYASDSWGPFGFDFEEAIPAGLSISSVSIKSYLGKADPGADLSAFTETTATLIDAVQSGPVSVTQVALYLNYPGVTLEGNHTVVFTVTLSNGAIHPFYFYKVKVH